MDYSQDKLQHTLFLISLVVSLILPGFAADATIHVDGAVTVRPAHRKRGNKCTSN